MARQEPSTSVSLLLRKLSPEDFAAALQAVLEERPELKANACKVRGSSLDSSGLLEGTTRSTSYAGQTVTSTDQTSSTASDEQTLEVSSGATSPQILPRNSETSAARSQPLLHPRPVLRIPQCWSVIFLVTFNGLMLATVASAYYMSIGSGHVTEENFYISSSIDLGWPHRIGAFGINVAFTAFIFAALTRYIAVKAITADQLPPSKVRSVQKLNCIAFAMEMWSVVCANGVGAFNVSFNYMVHITFAFMTFGSASVSIFIQSRIDHLFSQHAHPGFPIVSLRWRACRCFLCLVSLGGLIGMFIAGRYGYIEYSSMFELVMAGALFIYYASWLACGVGYSVGIELHALRGTRV